MQETQHIEWKETWRDEFLRWICGFANAEGGTLHIGRNDRGVVVGVADAKKLLVDIPNQVRDILGIVVPVNLHEEAGLAWLEIEVPAYPSPISYRGHYLELLETGKTRTPEETPVKTLGKALGKTLGKTPRQILELLQNDPTLTVSALAKLIGKSESAVNRAIRTCQSNGHLKRVGSRKSGHWEVLP